MSRYNFAKRWRFLEAKVVMCRGGRRFGWHRNEGKSQFFRLSQSASRRALIFFFFFFFWPIVVCERAARVIIVAREIGKCPKDVACGAFRSLSPMPNCIRYIYGNLICLVLFYLFIYFKKKISFTSIHCSSHLAATAGVLITRWSLNRRRTIAAGAAVNPPGG